MEVSAAPNRPQETGRFWSVGEAEFAAMRPAVKSQHAHPGRMLEKEGMGEQRLGKDRCTRCQQKGRECWVYTPAGESQFRKAGKTCAWCRVSHEEGGCSFNPSRGMPIILVNHCRTHQMMRAPSRWDFVHSRFPPLPLQGQQEQWFEPPLFSYFFVFLFFSLIIFSYCNHCIGCGSGD
jgi:hypothetical protein